jgi:DNA-directed RNA polymerase specialized sigma24 family protein
MAQETKPYFEATKRCEEAIRQFRRAFQANDRPEMTRAFEALIQVVRPILLRRASQLGWISEDAVREAYEQMYDRLLDNLYSPSFVSMETHFGAYLVSMPIRIMRLVKEKHRPSQVSKIIELDSLVEGEAREQHDVLEDKAVSATQGLFADRLMLEQAVARLTPQQQFVLWRRLIGVPNQAIAAELGISNAGATRLYQSALAQLRAILLPDS